MKSSPAAIGQQQPPRRPRWLARSACSIRLSKLSLAILSAWIITSSASCQPASSDSDGGRATTATAPTLPSDDQLRARIDAVLSHTEQQRALSLEDNAAWQILHAVLAFGRRFDVDHGREQVNALDWVLDGGAMRGWSMKPTEIGLRAELEPGKLGQGHEDQWLAVISQCGLTHKQPIVVGERTFQIYDLLKQSMYDTYEGKECSWSLIGLSRYLVPVDQEWQARDGETWSVERMIGMEAGDEGQWEQHINDAACGETHRLIGMTMALERYREQYPDNELSGGWQAAQQRIQWAIRAARQHQLSNGAFSLNYFQRSSNSPDLAEHLGATGHTLEFLALALDEEQLREPWVTRAANYLCGLFEKTQQIDLECGALYHAAHGLVLYRERRFGRPADHETVRQAERQPAAASGR